MPTNKPQNGPTLVRILNDGWLFGKLILLLLILGVSVTVFLHHFLPGILRGVASASRGGLKFSANLNGVTIETAGGFITRVITVPAYSMENYTDVWLKDGEAVEITATGFVETGNFTDWKQVLAATKAEEIIHKKYDLPKDEAAESTLKIAKQLLYLQLGNNYRFAWRNPDGNLEYNLDNKMLELDPANRDMIEEKKALPNHPYGCLLGYLSYKDGRDFPEGPLAPERVIKIGKENRLEFSRRVVTHRYGAANVSRSKVYLYLLVNDCIIEKSLLATLADRSEKLGHEYKLQACFFDPALPDRSCDPTAWQRKMRGLWYLNNAGSFTVVINKQ
ncbi:MAG: hypothetical protein HY913_13245 [Desulfomonile tiedjei]|nr:hypothetical protein [Desulfomonile tiedjei]